MKFPIVPDHEHFEEMFDENNVRRINADTQIGDDMPNAGTSGAWAEEDYGGVAQEFITASCLFKGALIVATSNRSTDRNIYRLYEGVWTLVYTESTASAIDVYSLCVHNGLCFAGLNIGKVLRSTDGITWALIGTMAYSIGAGIVYCMASWKGNLYAGLDEAMWISADDGATWTKTNDTNYIWYTCVADTDYLYAGESAGAATARIWRYDGSSWATVYTFNEAGTPEFRSSFIWHDRIYFGLDQGVIISSTTGAAGSWAKLTDLGAGVNRAFVEFNSKLLVASNDIIYESSDGLTFASFYDSAETNIFTLATYLDELYAGTSVVGKLLKYTIAGYIAGKKLTVMGNVVYYGLLLPNGTPFVAAIITDFAAAVKTEMNKIVVYKGEVLTYKGEVVTYG